MKKHSVAFLFPLCFLSASKAQVVEFNQISKVSLSAPFHGTPNGKSYTMLFMAHFGLPKPWGWPLTVTPNIRFNFPDVAGVSSADLCAMNVAPTHLGADYAAPASTLVYAIADGTVTKVNYYTTIPKKDKNGKEIKGTSELYGDYFVLVESGKNEKWTAVYGHLAPNSSLRKIGDKVNKGDVIGQLYNFTYAGDVPHLHLGIHPVSGPGNGVMGFTCEYRNTFGFISPESLKYETIYYW